MPTRAPPETDEGWYVLHDMRRVDWDAWRSAGDAERQRAIDEGREFLDAAERLSVLSDEGDAAAASENDGDEEDGDGDGERDEADAEGASACFAVLGHDADLMLLHLRPSLRDLDALERQFAQTVLAGFTERTDSYVSVTEASGYTGAADYFDPDAEADPGMRNYIESRLYPTLPDAEFVSFYPMDKRRGPEHNWYDLPFDDRAEHVERHGEIGRDYAGKVTQIIGGSVGLDDFEWGVTLFADDPTDVKDLLYEMRFDPSTSQFAEFGSFYSGRRFPPADLAAFLAGEAVPTDGERASGDAEAAGEVVSEDDDALDDEIAAVGADVPADGGHAVLVRSTADADALRSEVEGLRGNFEHYDTHRGTSVHELDGDGNAGDEHDDAASDDVQSAVASFWETASAADTASGFLAELEGTVETDVGPVGSASGDGEAERASAAENDASDSERDAPHAQGDGGAVAAGDADVQAALAEEGIYAGSPHGEDVHAVVCYSEADGAELAAEVQDLSDGFDRYDTHRGTTVYEQVDLETGDVLDVGAADGDESSSAPRAVVSLWETADAAETAADYLGDLPGIVRRAGEGEGEGFGTMGMFYAVQPEHREDFVETFGDVGDLLAELDGHRETALYGSSEDENDLFIASQWASKEDAMAFFRSDAFAETVEWGREVLADRPRHVFLA